MRECACERERVRKWTSILLLLVFTKLVRALTVKPFDRSLWKFPLSLLTLPDVYSFDTSLFTTEMRDRAVLDSLAISDHPRDEMLQKTAMSDRPIVSSREAYPSVQGSRGQAVGPVAEMCFSHYLVSFRDAKCLKLLSENRVGKCWRTWGMSSCASVAL